METIQGTDRLADPTLKQVLEYSKLDVLDVLERHFSGPIFLRMTWESLSNLSQGKGPLLSAVLRAMAAHYQLRSLMAMTDCAIGPLTLTNIPHSWHGHGTLLRLVEALIDMALEDEKLTENV